MNSSVIIVAAGSGLRCAADTPKQFVEVGARPLLMHTIEAFENNVQEIIVVVPSNGGRSEWQRLVEKHGFGTAHKVVEGDAERFLSVKKGLEAVNHNTDIVLVHDGVRPFVTPELIARMIAVVRNCDAAVPVIPVVDTLRKVSGGVLSRSEVMAVQTPQAFGYEVLKRAYEQPYNPGFTDDGSVVESAGYEIEMVEGESSNFKVTTPADMIITKKLLEKL